MTTTMKAMTTTRTKSEARSPKILTDSKGKKFDDSIFIVDVDLIACPPNTEC